MIRIRRSLLKFKSPISRNLASLLPSENKSDIFKKIQILENQVKILKIKINKIESVPLITTYNHSFMTIETFSVIIGASIIGLYYYYNNKNETTN